MQSTRFTN